MTALPTLKAAVGELPASYDFITEHYLPGTVPDAAVPSSASTDDY